MNSEHYETPVARVEGRPAMELTTRTSFGRRRRVLTVLRYLVIVVVLIFVLFPIFWIVGTAIKLPAEYMSNPPIWIPKHPTLVNFRSVMAERGNLAFRNSLIIAGIATLLTVSVGSIAAYSLARFQTGGRHFAFWLLSQRMMPPVVVIIPYFLLLRDAGKISPAIGLDSHAAMVALYTMAGLPFVIWMMRSYFAGIPAEIEESALVDGASRMQAFWRITVPLTLPGLIATATFAFIFNWTEFLFAVVFTRSNAVTVPVVIAGLTGSQGSNWGQGSALAVVATVPIFALGLLVQRHFVRGLTLGAVRG